MKRNSILKINTTTLSIVLGALVMFGGAGTAKADGRDDACYRNVQQQERELNRAIERHGFYSRVRRTTNGAMWSALAKKCRIIHERDSYRYRRLKRNVVQPPTLKTQKAGPILGTGLFIDDVVIRLRKILSDYVVGCRLKLQLQTQLQSAFFRPDRAALRWVRRAWSAAAARTRLLRPANPAGSRQ